MASGDRRSELIEELHTQLGIVSSSTSEAEDNKRAARQREAESELALVLSRYEVPSGAIALADITASDVNERLPDLASQALIETPRSRYAQTNIEALCRQQDALKDLQKRLHTT